MPVSRTEKSNGRLAWSSVTWCFTSTVHSTRRGEFDRVADQVQQHLLQAVRIAHHAVRHGFVDMDAQVQALFAGGHRENLDRLVHALAQREWDRTQVQLSGFDLGEIQNVVQQRQQGIRG